MLAEAERVEETMLHILHLQEMAERVVVVTDQPEQMSVYREQLIQAVVVDRADMLIHPGLKAVPVDPVL